MTDISMKVTDTIFGMVKLTANGVPMNKVLSVGVTPEDARKMFNDNKKWLLYSEKSRFTCVELTDEQKKKLYAWGFRLQ
jgi:hypothetical protein